MTLLAYLIFGLFCALIDSAILAIKRPRHWACIPWPKYLLTGGLIIIFWPFACLYTLLTWDSEDNDNL